MKNKRKVTTAIVAGVTAVALLLGGTFAWQSINQTALNEASDVINPGGRLHDDFDGTNKDIYVENFADEDIFARVRLEEYFAIIANYGSETAEKKTDIAGTAILDANGNIYDPEYAIHYFDRVNATDTYWTWDTDGSTVYMPTFNLNKDSLVADINGNYVDAIGGISNRNDPDRAQYENYQAWAEGDTKTDTEIYDGDTDMEDEVKSDFESLANYTDSIVTVADKTHTAKATGNGTLISMADWLAMVDAAGSYDATTHGNFWVYDTDGWVYWSAPIAGRNEDGTTNATGLLLDGIELNQVMDDTWYYAINVVAQFVTADDVGNADSTGFYDIEAGSVPTTEAEDLLRAIGVTSVDDEAGVQDPDAAVYTMHLYFYEDPAVQNNAQYLVPNREYTVSICADPNDYGDTAVSLSLEKDDGTKLVAGTDYKIEGTANFSEYTGDIGGYAYEATTKLTILNEQLVGEYIKVTATADNSGNTSSEEKSVNYDQIDVSITLYDKDGKIAAGTEDDSTLATNAIYDIVGTVKGADGTEYVIYSTLDSRPVSENISVPQCDVWAAAGAYHESNYINDDGKLVVGVAETFNCNEVQDDGITYNDSLTLCVNAEVVRVYDSAQAMANGDEPTEIYYTYGQWDIYPDGQEVYDVYVDADVYISQPSRNVTITVSDGNDRDIMGTDGLVLKVSGNTDDTTKIEFKPETTDYSAYYELTLGENETATSLTITAEMEGVGSGSETINVHYLNTLKIGNEESDAYNNVYITSSDVEKTCALTLVDYRNNPVSNVTYEVSGNYISDTRVDGSTLYIGAQENASMILSATVNGETTIFDVHVTYVADTTE